MATIPRGQDITVLADALVLAPGQRTACNWAEFDPNKAETLAGGIEASSRILATVDRSQIGLQRTVFMFSLVVACLSALLCG